MRYAPHLTLHHHTAVHAARHDQDRRHEHVDGPPASPYLGLGIILSATFVQLLDASIVTVAVPAIQADLDAPFSSIQLMIAVYVLAFACTLVTAARLGDIHGRKRMFLIGMTGFTIASALCGLAPTATVLVLSRALQGVMSGLMFPQVLSVIQVTFTPAERGKALGIFGGVIGMASVMGPLAGGALIELDLFDLGWRAIFLVNLPIGIAAIALAVPYLSESRAPQAAKLDLVGALLVMAGLFLVIYPLVEGRSRGWPLWIWAMLLAAVPVILGFLAYEKRLLERGGTPLLAVSLFAERAFDVGLLVTILFFSGLTSFFFTLMLYLQIGFGFTALEAGLTTLPFALAVGVASGTTDGLTARLGRGVLLLGAVFLAVGFGVMAVTVAAADTDVSGWQLLPGMVVAGIGCGLFVAPLTGILLAHIAPKDVGSASGVFTTTQEFAGAVGLALIGVAFFSFLAGNADRSVDAVTPTLRSELSAAGLPAPAADGVLAGFRACFTDRSEAEDPGETPASCEPQAGAPALPPAATQALADAAPRALRQNFSRTFAETLIPFVVLFAVVGLAVLLLPRREPPSLTNEEVAAEADLSGPAAGTAAGQRPRAHRAGLGAAPVQGASRSTGAPALRRPPRWRGPRRARPRCRGTPPAAAASRGPRAAPRSSPRPSPGRRRSQGPGPARCRCRRTPRARSRRASSW